MQLGRDAVDGAKMAVDEINAKGGILGRQIRVVIVDEGLNVQQGVAAVRKLIADDKVDVIIGAATSGVVLAQVQQIAASKTPFLSVDAATTGINALIKRDPEKYKYVFRPSPQNSARQEAAYIDFLVNKVRKEMGYDKIAIVGQNSRFIQDIVPGVKAGVEKAGMKVTAVELFDVATSDFSPIFSRVKSSGAEFMMVFMTQANSDAFVKQWYDIKLPIPIGGLDVKAQDTNFFSRIGGKAVSEIVVNVFPKAALTPKTVPFWEKFQKLFGREPIATGGGGYDAVYIYADAAERAKTIDADAVVKALETTNFVGVEGGIAFDSEHDVKDGPGGINAAFVQWQADGSRHIVWPPDMVSGKTILPPWMDPKK
jgi:branched-chain amino acid transport system substrate-binding protein